MKDIIFRYAGLWKPSNSWVRTRQSDKADSIDDRPTDLSSLLLFAESKDFSRGALFQMSVTIYFQKKSVWERNLAGIFFFPLGCTQTANQIPKSSEVCCCRAQFEDEARR